jgi:hypothetical protein
MKYIFKATLNFFLDILEDFHISWYNAENFDASIKCTFLNTISVGIYFMKTVLISCINFVYR